MTSSGTGYWASVPETCRFGRLAQPESRSTCLTCFSSVQKSRPCSDSSLRRPMGRRSLDGRFRGPSEPCWILWALHNVDAQRLPRSRNVRNFLDGEN